MGGQTGHGRRADVIEPRPRQVNHVFLAQKRHQNSRPSKGTGRSGPHRRLSSSPSRARRSSASPTAPSTNWGGAAPELAGARCGSPWPTGQGKDRFSSRTRHGPRLGGGGASSIAVKGAPRRSAPGDKGTQRYVARDHAARGCRAGSRHRLQIQAAEPGDVLVMPADAKTKRHRVRRGRSSPRSPAPPPAPEGMRPPRSRSLSGESSRRIGDGSSRRS